MAAPTMPMESSSRGSSLGIKKTAVPLDDHLLLHDKHTSEFDGTQKTFFVKNYI